MCGVDGSEVARGAAEAAKRLASRLGFRLDVVRVAGDPDAPGDDDAQVELVDPDGSPARTLARLARERAAGLVVVGSRGRGTLSGALLGSVSQELVELADRPVVVVPPAPAGKR